MRDPLPFFILSFRLYSIDLTGISFITLLGEVGKVIPFCGSSFSKGNKYMYNFIQKRKQLLVFFPCMLRNCTVHKIFSNRKNQPWKIKCGRDNRYKGNVWRLSDQTNIDVVPGQPIFNQNSLNWKQNSQSYVLKVSNQNLQVQVLQKWRIKKPFSYLVWQNACHF